MKRVLLPLVVSLFAACGHSTLHTATPVERGAFELSGHLGVPDLFNVQGRYGIAKFLDVGGRLGTGGAGFDFNFALFNNQSIAVAINPSANIDLSIGKLFLGSLLLDLKFSSTAILTLGGKGGYAEFDQLNGDFFTYDVDGPVVGGVLLMKFQVSDRVAVIPGVDLLYELEENQPNSSLKDWFFAANVGLAYKFGGNTKTESPRNIDRRIY